MVSMPVVCRTLRGWIGFSAPARHTTRIKRQCARNDIVTRDFDLTFIPNLNTEEWSVILVLPLLVEWTVCVCQPFL